MKHGFARVSIWTNDPVFEEDGYSICRFHLSASENTRSIWNYEFALTYEVRINADSLSTELKYIVYYLLPLELTTQGMFHLSVSVCFIPITRFLRLQKQQLLE